MGKKPPPSSPPVVKMDAIYFFWHSNYIDVCRQLFQHGAFLQLPFLLSHLTLLGHKSGRAWVGGIISLGGLPGELGRLSLQGPMMFLGWSEVRSRLRCRGPSPVDHNSALHPAVLDVNEDSGASRVARERSNAHARTGKRSVR